MTYAGGPYGAQAYAGAAPASYATAVLADAPWGFWRLAEAPGVSAWLDSSGNSRAMSASGATRITGPSGSGATFANGGEGHTDSSLTRATVGTFEVWVRCSNAGTHETPLLSHSPFSGGNGATPRLSLLANGKAQLNVYSGADNNLASSASVADGLWHHVVGSVGAAGMKLYVDGALVASNAAIRAGLNINDSCRVMLHNGNLMDITTPLDLAEPAFYTSQLSDARVAAHYAAVSSGSTSPSFGLNGTIPGPTAAITGTATVPSYASQVLADTPLGYWRLGEASGTTMGDSSGNGRSGAYSGAVSLGATSLLTGDSDTAASFAGGAAYLPTYAAWQSPASFTVEALIKPTSTSGTRVVASRQETGGADWTFRMDSGVLTLWLVGTGGFSSLAGPTLTAGTTYHVAATYDGTTARIYVNGAEVASGAKTYTNNTTSLFRIGASGAGEAFAGTIDEVAYYGTALSQARLAAHYAGGAAAPPLFTGVVTGAVPSPAASLSGVAAPPGVVSGTLTGTVSSPAASAAGTASPPVVTGVLAGSAPSPTAAATGTATPPPSVSGTLTGVLPSPTGSGTGGPFVIVPGDAWPGTAIVLDADYTYDSDNASSISTSLEAGEPVPAGYGRTFWWHVTPADSVTLSFDLLDSAPVDFVPVVDPTTDEESEPPAVGVKVAVYTGTSVGSLQLVISGPQDGLEAALAAGETYYIQASLRTGAPDVAYQLSVGPPMNAELYAMDLEVLSPVLRAAPTSVTVAVAGGLPNDQVTFQIDGVETDSATLDDDGSLEANSVDVPDGYGAGDHIVSVHSSSSALAGEDTFHLQRGPYRELTTVGVDSPPVEIPSANTATGVRRWIFQDLMAGGEGSYVLPRNPSEMSSPQYQRTLTQAHTTAVDGGQYHLNSVARTTVDWTFSGYLESRAEVERFEAFYGLKRRFYVIDHRSRAWIVTFVALELTPRMRQRDDDGWNDWAHNYKVTALIYDQDWSEPT